MGFAMHRFTLATPIVLILMTGDANVCHARWTVGRAKYRAEAMIALVATLPRQLTVWSRLRAEQAVISETFGASHPAVGQ